MALLRILILSDGRPGHFNLAEGIAAALERLAPATTQRLDVRRGRWPGAVLAGLTRAGLPARRMLATVYGIAEGSVPACDVIVSAGAETLAASVWLARARGVPNIFYGSLRAFAPTDFALVLTSYERNAGRPHHALFLKPSRLDPDRLGTPSEGERRSARIALLVGGDAGPIRFAPQDWDGLLRLVRTTAERGGTKWLIANSRRTPAEFSDMLAREAAANPAAVAAFLDVRTAGPGTLPGLLAQATAALCTADSSSMISECIWARRPTVALEPAQCAFDADETAYRQWLANSGWSARVPIAGLTGAQLELELARIVPLIANPQQQLAELLASRLPALAGGAEPAKPKRPTG